jgi:hypothetical protein
LRGRFLPREETKRHSRESGNPARGQQSWVKSPDARLRGHDGLAHSNGQHTRDNCKVDEKPPFMRRVETGAPSGVGTLRNQVGEHLGWVAARVDCVVGFENLALFVNEIADTFRITRLDVVAGPVG